MTVKSGITLGIVAVVGIVVVGVLFSTIEVNYAQNWQIYQHVGGKVDVIDSPGWYLKLFGKVWTYPRYVEATYNDEVGEGRKQKEAVRATFNDGGTAEISTYVKYATPTAEEQRKEFHRQFSGNIENSRTSVKAHLNQCIKAASPLMSSSENQSARKAEYAQIIESMLRNGLYKMRKVEKELKDRYDEHGKAVTVWATEVLLNNEGIAQIERQSPLKGYGIEIMQFSVTGTEYDPETRKQFAAKKQAFLYAEQAKAEREQQVQERLKMVEQKLAEKAEIEGEAEKEKAKLTIAAEMRVAVERQQKLEEGTRANKMLEVAKIEKMEAETRASKDLEVARIQASAALERKKAMIAEAEGKQKAIELSGEITNLEAYIIDAEVSKAEKVAQAIAKINVPRVMISGAGGIGGEGGAGGMNMMENILALLLLDKGDFINLTESGVEVSQERLAHIKNPSK
jgi:hypothetical protein